MDGGQAAQAHDDIKRLFAQYWDGRSASLDAQPQHISQSDGETAAWKDILHRLAPRPVISLSGGRV